MTESHKRVDPVTQEIVRNLLIAILDEGEINLSRTAFSPIIYEVKDYCVGLVDREGRTIAQSRGGIPTFMADLGEPVRDGIAIYGLDGFEPGDVMLMNYAAVCGQHLNNVVVYVPVHWKGEVVAFAATRAHWTDVGGRVAGSFSTDTTEIYQEGLQLRSIKIHKAGRVDEELMRVIRHNIRFPDLSFGDMAAQIAACTLSAKRFQEMMGKYSWETLEACIHTIWDQSEAFVRRQISALPDGRYSANSYLDDDGVVFDKILPVAVTVIVDGDEMEIDFTGTAPQSRGPMNSGRSGGLAAARVAFKSAVVPNLPPNEGVFRALRVVLPEGTIISAVDNAALAQWNMPLKTVIDTIYWALSKCAPERVPAAHHCSQGMYSFFGKDHETGRRFSTLDTALGGWGARPDADGFSPLKTVTHGDTRNVPVEVEEAFYPLLVERFEWRPDSAGPGKFRGGLGLRKTYRLQQDVEMVVAFERSKLAPWGLFGGGSAQVGFAEIRQPGEATARKMFKGTAVPLQQGATVEFYSAGGGGRFPAWERPVARVEEDVRQGYITADGARKDYGVAIDPATFVVDISATEILRSELQKAAQP